MTIQNNLADMIFSEELACAMEKILFLAGEIQGGRRERCVLMERSQ